MYTRLALQRATFQRHGGIAVDKQLIRIEGSRDDLFRRLDDTDTARVHAHTRDKTRGAEANDSELTRFPIADWKKKKKEKEKNVLSRP